MDLLQVSSVCIPVNVTQDEQQLTPPCSSCTDKSLFPTMLETALIIYYNPRSYGTFVVSDQEKIDWEPTQKILKTPPSALYSPKHYFTWAKYKEMAHSCYTYFYITLGAPWFLMLSSQNWNPTSHFVKGISYLFSASGNIRSRSRCNQAADEGKNSAVLLH